MTRREASQVYRKDSNSDADLDVQDNIRLPILACVFWYPCLP